MVILLVNQTHLASWQIHLYMILISGSSLKYYIFVPEKETRFILVPMEARNALIIYFFPHRMI